MDGLDRTLQRIYERLGSRIIVACHVVNFTYGYLLGLTFGLGWGRAAEVSTDSLLLSFAMWAVVFATCTIVVTIGVLRSARPLLSWIDGDRGPEGAEEAWRSALQLPRTTVRWYALTTLLSTPVFTVLLNLIEPDSLPVVLGGYAFGYLVGVGAITAGTAFTAQLAARPMARAAANAMTVHPSPPRGVSVRLRLLGLAPALLLPPLLWGVMVAVEPGIGVRDGLLSLSVGVALVAVFGVPPALLLAYSTLQPLDDVLRATERLKAGDLNTRVPELSADEHGRLARSFNEAIQGLAERERLAVENAHLLEEVRASRARIVAASDAERRRVERNIHDGAQQRLVAVALKLRLLEERLGDDEDLRAVVAHAGESLKGAVGELRELARGLHPSVLTTDGLRPALRQLAARSPVTVSVTAPEERFPDAVESTAYFVASEALANVTKYANASHAEIAVEHRNASVFVTVSDDGVGGAHDNGAGTGLTGLADRVAAVNGRLIVESPPSAGTRVIAQLPLT